MRTQDGAIGFELYLNSDPFRRGIAEAKKELDSLGKRSKSEAEKMNETFKNIAKTAAAAFAGFQLAQLPGQIVRVRGEFQQLEIALNTMLGSKSKADQLMAKIVEFAAKTPYGLKDTASAAKQLLAYGESAENVIDTLRRLGDIASGIGAPLGDIAYLYGTTMTQGRLYTQDLNQFLGRGIPMIKELAKIFDVAEDEVKGLVEAGKVGFPEVQKAIENLTASGSMFGGLMEAQSKSLVGLQAALGDAIDSMLNDIGKSQEGILTTVFETTIAAVENYEKVVDVLKVVIATYGAYRAALMLTAAIQAAPALIAQVKLWHDLTRSIKSAKDAQILFNLASKANPYVLVATALTGIVSAFVLFNKEATKAERAQNSLNEAMKKGEDAAAAEQAKIQVLTATINNEAASRYERNKALEELIRLSPDHLSALTLENIKTEEGVTAINNYIDAKKRQLELQEIERELQESIERQNKAKRNEHDLPFLQRLGLSAASSFGDMDYNNAVASERRRFNNEIIKSEDELQAKFKDRIAAITGIDIATNKSAENTKNAIVKTIKWYEEEIKALRDKQSKASTRQEFDAIEKEIKKLELEKAQITGEQIKASAKSAAETEKELRIKTFRDELAEKRHMYELYERWVSYVGKEAADEQFKELRKGGKTYLDWLNTEIQRLENLRDFQYAGFSDQDRSDLDQLFTERERLQGEKSGIETFKQDLSDAREEAESLVEYLRYLEAVQRGLSGDNSILGREKAIHAASEAIATKREIRSQLDSFLKEVVGSEEKRIAIQAKYATLREALEQRYADNKTEAYTKALAKIDKAENEEYEKDRQQLFESSKEYRALVQDIENSRNGSLSQQIAAQKRLVDAALAAGGESYQEYVKAYQELIRLQKQLAAEQKVSAEIILNFAGRLGQALSQFDGELGSIGRMLSDVASISLDVNKIMDENATAAQKWGSAAEIAGTIITNIARIIRERKEAEADYYRSIIAYQNQYNLALVQQARIGEDNITTIWGTSFSDKIKAAQEAIVLANDQLGGVLSKLEEVGQVKVGTETKSAWENIVAGAVSGAVYGGIAGAGVFSAIGAVIGAVGGAIVGWLTGRKSEDIYGDLETVVPGLIRENAAGVKELDIALARSLMDAGLLNDETRLLLENAINLQEEINAAKEQIESVVSELVGQMGQNLKSALVGAFVEGQSAALAWGSTVEKVLENIIEQMAYAATIKPFLDKYTQQLTDAVAANDYNAITDIMADIVKTGTDVGEMFMKILKTVKDQAKAQGMDLWSKQNDLINSTTGNRISATEETVSLLAGQFNAVRIYTAQTEFNTRGALLHLSTIAANTSFNRHLVRLEGMYDELRNIRAALKDGRSSGL